MTKPILNTFNQIAPLIIQRYESYSPTAFDNSLSLLQKMNMIIEYLNTIGEINNSVVEQWNTVAEWIINEGISEEVNEKINDMVTDGTMDEVINQEVFGALNTLIQTLNGVANSALAKANNPLTLIADNTVSAKKLIQATDADKIKLANLSDEVKNYMTGTTPVGTTPADGSVTTAKIGALAVTPDKLANKGKTRNKGTIFPFKQVTRDGILSPERSYINDIILDVKLYGAKQGKYYKIEWMGNGTTAFGAPNYKILMTEYDAINFATVSGTGKKDIITLNDEVLSVAPTENIFTQIIQKSGMTLVVTLDYSVFVAQSYSLNSTTPTDHGFSHIIDPECYIYTDGSSKKNKVVLDVANNVAKVYGKYGKNDDILFLFQKMNVNNTFALWQVWKKSNRLSDIQTFIETSGVAIKGGSTDLIGPYSCEAINNGDGNLVTDTTFTGGAHSTDNNTSTGNPTAETSYIRYLIDGKPITVDGTYDGDVVDIHVKNRIMSGNTMLTARRYTHEEHIRYRIIGSKVQVDMCIIPLEQIKINRYYGLQFVTDYYTQILYPNGIYGTQNVGSDSDSGERQKYRNNSALLINGFETMEMYLEDAIGLGDRKYTPQTSPMVFATTSKVYNWLIGNGTKPTFNAGDVLSWRGYYDFRKSV